MVDSTTPGNDTITGTPVDDILYGHHGNDTLSGGDGADLFVEGYEIWVYETNANYTFNTKYDFGKGSDVLDGGTGLDLVIYDDLRRSFVADLTAGTVTSGADTDRLISIEGVAFGKGDDLVTSAGNFEYIAGGDGRDTLDLSKEDRLMRVSDFVPEEWDRDFDVYIPGFEVVRGAKNYGNVIQAGGEVFGGDMSDTLFISGRNNTVRAGGGNDDITIYAGDTTAYGGDGDDSFTSTVYRAKLHIIAGNGQDDIKAEDGRILIEAGKGNDSVEIGDRAEKARVFLNGGRDVFSGYADIVDGGGGNDRITNRDGDVHGGSGRDTIIRGNNVYGGADDDIIKGAVWAWGEDGDDKFIATIYGSSGTVTHSRELYGGKGNDTFLISNPERLHVVNGGQGDDVFRFLPEDALKNRRVASDAAGFNRHDSVLSGGSGYDKVISNGGEIALASEDVDPVGNLSWLYIIDVEEVVFSEEDDELFVVGGSYDLKLRDGQDVATIASDGNRIHMGEGRDKVSVTGGNNEIIGGDGRDKFEAIEPGEGNIFIGGEGDDLFDIEASALISGGEGADTIEASAYHRIEGGSGNDSIVARSQIQEAEIFAGKGHDSLTVVGFAQRISLGEGNDDLVARLAGEVSLKTGEGQDAINLVAASGGYVLTLHDMEVGQDTLTSDRALDDWDSVVEQNGSVVLTIATERYGDQIAILENMTMADFLADVWIDPV